MVRSYERAQRERRMAGVVVPLVWGGVVWGLSEWVGRGWFGLEGWWAWVVGVGVAVVGVPVVGFLVYLGVVMLWPLVTGKRVDWR